MTAWQPVTANEHALVAALGAGSEEEFLTELAATPLLLPISPQAAAGNAPLAWTTGRHEGVVYVLAYTSPEAIAACLPGQPVSYRVSVPADLALDWPDDEWVLAVNPGLPIAARLTADDLRALTERMVQAEEPLRDAIARQDPEDLAAALLRAELVLPVRPDGPPSRDLSDPEFGWWNAPDAQGQQQVPVFTSEMRLRQAFGDREFVVVSSLQLAENWPDPSWQLLLNPETPLAAALPGEALLRLRDWLGELRDVLTDAAEQERRKREVAAYADPSSAGVPVPRPPADHAAPEAESADGPDPALPLRLQLVIPHRYMPSYLNDGYDRAAGLVHAWHGPERDTPVRLYRRLGLLGDGSPFGEADEWVPVLRWEPDEETPAEWGLGRPRMESLVVPDGTELRCLHRDGRDELLARFDSAARCWQPAQS